MYEFMFVRECLSRLICSAGAGGAAGGGGTGGGAGGAASGGGDGGAGDGDDAEDDDGKPKPMTAEQVNRAIKDHTGRMTKAFQTQMAALVEQNTQLAAALEKLSKPAAGGQGGAGSGTGDAGAVSPEITKQLADLSAKLEKATKLAADEKAARETERSTTLAKEERSALKDALLERGVPAVQAPVLAAYLHGEAKVIGRDADGTVVYKKGDELLELGEGLDDYLKTDAGKAWLPPRSAQGSGATGTGNAGGKRGKGPVSLEEVGAFLETNAWSGKR